MKRGKSYRTAREQVEWDWYRQEQVRGRRPGCEAAVADVLHLHIGSLHVAELLAHLGRSKEAIGYYAKIAQRFEQGGFEDLVGRSPAMREVFESTNRLQERADNEIQALAVGKNGDLHKTMIAMEEADVSFQLLMQIRNKIVAAYQEIMRMQV